MNINDLGAILTANNWSLDKFGHFKRTIGDTLYRVRVQARSVRIEKQALIGGKNEWVRISKDYLKNIHLTADRQYIQIGSVQIGSVRIKGKGF